MRKILTFTLLTLCLGSLLTFPASALEYNIEGAQGGAFGPPTSVEPVTVVDTQERGNVDRSKNAALVPPPFGSESANALNIGEPLTPNLITTTPAGTASNPTVYLPDSPSGVPLPTPDFVVDQSGWSGYPTTAFTAVTSDMYYASGHLGTLKIPAIGLTVKVYEGTGSTPLSKGAGHFSDTSIWDGNICLAGHNRGVNNHFGKLHTLELGDRITLTTKQGTRTYEVVSVAQVSETDTSALTPTADNRLTLYTCVRDVRDKRWCVQAVEIT